MKRKGLLVISLDFELLWGVVEKTNSKDYAESNVKNVPIVIDKMLDLFEKYGVKATFAIVGFLMCKDKEDACRFFPNLKPSYTDKKLSPYGDYFDKISPNEQSLYFAPIIVNKLKRRNNIEIGSHTFCHYYCWEKGQTINQFEEDVKSAINVATEQGVSLKSIVFPRNEVTIDYLKVCHKYGITSFRGNARKYYSNPKNRFEQLRNRFLRLVDTYIPIGGRNSYKYEELEFNNFVLNIPASRFFRPFSNVLFLLEPLRVFRIKREIKYAAKRGELYHLWWHPHNFGANINKNLKNLENILKYFDYCNKKYGMQSYTMNELSNMFCQKDE